MNTILFLLLLLIVLFSVVYFSYRQWREHQQRKLAAAARGWRYQPRGWRSLMDNQYSIVGSTATGIIWELRRIQEGRQLYLRWTTENATLKHGFLQILSQNSVNKHPLPAELLKHQVIGMGSKDWQKVYLLLTTHQFLAKKYVIPELEQAMLEWPHWPEPGAFVRMSWQKNWLHIDCLYHDDWTTVDRIVTLGSLLTVNHVNAPLVKTSKL